MSANWTDITSYKQGDKERKPTSWSTEIGVLRIVITNSHRDYPGEWVMHCFECRIDTLPIKADTDNAAKTKAIETVRELIRGWQEALDRATK